VDVIYERQSAFLWVPSVLLFLYTYSFVRMRPTSYRNFSRKKLKRSKPDPFTIRNIRYVLSLTNSKFRDYVDSIYHIELEIKDNTYTARSVSYLDLHLEIDSECCLRTTHYDKWDGFNIPIVNCRFKCSNIPAASYNEQLQTGHGEYKPIRHSNNQQIAKNMSVLSSNLIL
jgi:hypothetical protein